MSQTLEYKNYDGSVLYSAEDKLLHGRIVGLRDAVTYAGTDVRFCTEEGKTPDKPFKGSFNVRVGAELHKKAALYAEEHDKKLNSVVQDALEKYLNHAR